MSVIEAVREAMHEEMARDDDVFVMGEDIGARGGVFLATDGFMEDFGEERVIDTPLAESSIAGIALGAAMNGMRPIAEIEFADFIWPTFNQIVGEAARVRYGTNGDVGVPLVLRAPYGGGVRGGLYHSQSPEAYFAHTPGLKVVTPATPYDAKGLLKSAIRDDDPVVFLEHKRTYRLVRGEVPEGDYSLPIGEAEVKLEGEDLSVITYGLMLHHCIEAARALADEGVGVEVLDLRTLRPLDEQSIVATAEKTGKVLIVHEDTKAGGIGGEVAAIVAEQAFDYLDAPIARLAGPEVPRPCRSRQPSRLCSCRTQTASSPPCASWRGTSDMKIELPHVGESVTEAVIDKWLKQVGDSVEKFDPLAEVVTDKVSMEMPSPATGILTKILVQEGQTVLMGTVVAEIAVEGEELVEEGTPLPEPGRADRIGSLVRDVTPVGPTGSGGPITTGTTPEAGHSKQRFSRLSCGWPKSTASTWLRSRAPALTAG